MNEFWSDFVGEQTTVRTPLSQSFRTGTAENDDLSIAIC